MVTIRIGILYSTQGPYAAVGRDCRDGAELAIQHIRDSLPAGIAIEPVYGDPVGESRRYLDLARAMLREEGCRHIVGAITSLSRKDIIPLIEKYDGLLWYVCPYEGFEANENVIYTGACPNQHLLPLFDYLLPRYGSRAYLVGANYVWGWEMNRLARELIGQAGGEILGERYLPLEEDNADRLLAEVEQQRPDFILNNLIGPSSYAFLAGMQRLADRDSHFAPENCPVVSCDLTECELGEIAGHAATGQLCTASYFDSLDTPHNAAFKQRVAARFGKERLVSSFFAGAYTAVRLCAESILKVGDDTPVAVRADVRSGPVETVLGELTIDPLTNHAALPFHLGRVKERGGFEILNSRPAVAADPYLVGNRAPRRGSHLRVVR